MTTTETTPILISGVSCYEQDGTAYLRLEDVARGLGITQSKNGFEYIRWDRVDQYLSDLGFPHKWGKSDFIPENIFYRLAMKAKNETAEKFQALVADEIIPCIRKTGCYGAPNLSELSPELRCLIRLEQQQKQQAQEIVRLNQKLNQLQGARAFGTGGWRRESAQIINRVAQARGGPQYIPRTYQEAYMLLEEREHCSLSKRLDTLRAEQRQQGMSKTRAGRMTKMDVIATDPRSVELWLKILNELAYRYGEASPEEE